MHQLTHTNNYQGMQLTVTAADINPGLDSATIEGDRDTARMRMEHVSNEYRQALQGGWDVTFSSQVGEDGRLTLLDLWLLKKMINDCSTFQTAWMPIAESGRSVRILRDGKYARVQFADQERLHQAQTVTIDRVTFCAVLEQLSRVINTTISECVIHR